MLLEVKDLSVAYGNNVVLQDVKFAIAKKNLVAITGDNGSGKTTLLRTIMGLINPTSGELIKSDELNIGYVPQIAKFDKNFPITVKEVILSGCIERRFKLFYRYPREEVKKAYDLMGDFGLMDLKKRTLNTLSGGQLQKVLICRALMSQPHMLVLDEPTASIDDSTTEEIFKLLARLSHKLPVLIVTHDQKRVHTYADVIYDMQDKQLIRIK